MAFLNVLDKKVEYREKDTYCRLRVLRGSDSEGDIWGKVEGPLTQQEIAHDSNDIGSLVGGAERIVIMARYELELLERGRVSAGSTQIYLDKADVPAHKNGIAQQRDVLAAIMHACAEMQHRDTQRVQGYHSEVSRRLNELIA